MANQRTSKGISCVDSTTMCCAHLKIFGENRIGSATEQEYKMTSELQMRTRTISIAWNETLIDFSPKKKLQITEPK